MNHDASDLFALVLVLMCLGLLCTPSRVFAAWMVFFSLRWRANWRRPKAARWLWLSTLAYANGVQSGDARRAARAKRRLHRKGRLP